MCPDTRAVIIALTNPSRVATRSFITGTSCGFTVVTRTSGAAGETLVFLREQAKGNETRISAAVTTVSRFILWLWLIANASVERRKKPDKREIWMRRGPPPRIVIGRWIFNSKASCNGRVINDPDQLVSQILRPEMTPSHSELRSVGNRQECRCRSLRREN